MPFFIAKMVHPDGPGWNEHLAAHAQYLRELVASGELRMSGPLKEQLHRTGFLIFKAPDRAAVEALIADDPFSTAGLIQELSIDEWDPLFGALAPESSGQLAGLPQDGLG